MLGARFGPQPRERFWRAILYCTYMCSSQRGDAARAVRLYTRSRAHDGCRDSWEYTVANSGSQTGGQGISQCVRDRIVTRIAYRQIPTHTNAVSWTSRVNNINPAFRFPPTTAPLIAPSRRTSARRHAWRTSGRTCGRCASTARRWPSCWASCPIGRRRSSPWRGHRPADDAVSSW